MSDQVDIDKQIASITKGSDKKNDALMLMTPECNWAQFLAPAPYAVAILGQLLLVSAGTDFSLEEKPPKDGFQYIKYPNSFRSSLVQVSHTGWENFNTANSNMEQIRFHCGNVDTHVKTAVKFLLRGSAEEIKVLLPMCLNKIQRIADECLLLSTDVEKGFVDMMSLISELLEASTNTKGVYEQKKTETETAIKVATVEKSRLTQDVEESKKRLKKMDEEVADAQKQFKEAIDSIPSGGELLGLQLGEAFVGFVSNVLQSGSAYVDSQLKNQDKNKTDQKPKSQNPDLDLDLELATHAVYKQAGPITARLTMLGEIMKGQKPNWKRIQNGDALFILNALKAIKSSVEREVKSGNVGERAIKLCNDSIIICNQLIQMSKSLSGTAEADVAKLVSKVDFLQKEAQIFEAESIKELRVNPLDKKSPNISKMSKGGLSASEAAINNARFKTETAKETLRDAKRRQEKTAEQLQEKNKRLTEVLMNMAKLNIDQVDFDTIRKTLIEGINALAELREQWSKLVQFFQKLSNIIKCCLNTALTGFVDEVKAGREFKLGTKAFQLSAIFRDVIFEHASKCSQIAFVVYTIANTYVKISEKYIMEKVTSLGRLITLDPKKDKRKITIEKNKLFTGCKEAQNYIRTLVLKEKNDFGEKIEDRISQIRKLEKELPTPEAQTVAEIKDSVKKGFRQDDNDAKSDDESGDSDDDLDDLV